MKILLVEDNSRLAERISYHLSKAYIVDAVSSGEEALEKIQHIEYGVVLLDLGLPGISGLDVCKNMRTLGFNHPILVLTGSGGSADKVGLLDAGADDYVTKPFDKDELRARIAAVGRRQYRSHIRTHIEYRDLKIDTEQQLVSRAGIKINLRRKEFDILEYLITNRGRIMTRNMIMNHVWSSTTNSWTSTVDVHIKHLRDKVDKPFTEQYIKTAYGLGYKVDDK
jgi:DNA-binding response OmpR family regulator